MLMMMGTSWVAGSASSASTISIPDMPGMCRSQTITLGRWVRASSRPLTPSGASLTTKGRSRKSPFNR